jgi:hypothetical protein
VVCRSCTLFFCSIHTHVSHTCTHK